MYLSLILEQNPNAKEVISPYTTLDKFVEVISRPSYNLNKDLGFSNKNRASLMLKKLFPHRINDGSKIHLWLLRQANYKICYKCKQVLSLDSFNSNSSKYDKHSDECKTCDYSNTAINNKHNVSAYRSRKIKRTPKWADLDKIKEIYSKCPKGYHVDHIIPLNGNMVSGLHVENNLQYLTAKDNFSKGNRTSLV